MTLGSPLNPAYSAKQIRDQNPAALDGVYWFDVDGPDGEEPFEAYADMTTDGGGWMLAINSVIGSEATNGYITTNTGIVSLGTAHNRRLLALSVDQTAEIRHEIDATNQGLGVLHRKYAGIFTDPLPSQGAWTPLAGETSPGLLSANYGAPYQVHSQGTAWYFNGSLGAVPSTPSNGFSGPSVQSDPNLLVNSYRVWIRETNTPAPPMVLGDATQAENYELRRAGDDGLLGTSDDPIIAVTPSLADNVATLNFGALPEDVYRLTVRDAITDFVGLSLDGNGDGIAGGDWIRDFVVGAQSHSFTSPNGFAFDAEFGGFGAGQLVHGAGNAFDGLNRLQVGPTNFVSPMPIGPSVGVTEYTTTTSASLSNSYTIPPGLSSFTAFAAGKYYVSGTVTVQADQSYFGYSLFRNGSQVETRFHSPSPGASFNTVHIEDVLTPAEGDYVELRVLKPTGVPMSFGNFGPNGGAALRVLQFNDIPGFGPSVGVTEYTTTTSASLSNSYTIPPGLSSFTAFAAGKYYVSGTVTVQADQSYFGYSLFRNGSQVETRFHSPSPGASFNTVHIEDVLT